MARVAGIDLNDQWKIDYALTRIRGIGWTTSKKILEELDFTDKGRVSDLTSEEIGSLTKALEKYVIEGELASKVRGDINRLKQADTYRGLRHSKGLPARGQRTRRNARTKRGKRKTVGAFRKEALTKQQQTQKTAE